jgi:hypothetical protein
VASFQTGRIDAATDGKPAQLIILPRLHSNHRQISIYYIQKKKKLVKDLQKIREIFYFFGIHEIDNKNSYDPENDNLGFKIKQTV